MAPPTDQLDCPETSARVRLEPFWYHHIRLAGTWWPGSGEPGAELAALVPVLDRAGGQVTRLLLSAAGWTARPHHIVAAGHPVSVGYQAGQSPHLMTVLRADGSASILRVTRPGSASDDGGPA